MGKKTAGALRPFVVDKRSEDGADPSYTVCWTWEEALRAAGRFWESFEGTFDPEARQPFLAGEGYDQEDVEVTLRRGRYLRVVHARGSGPCITVERADAVLGPPPGNKK